MNSKTFYPFYKERITEILKKIQREVRSPERIRGSVWPCIEAALYEIMHRASVRTLITEMHVCLETGRIGHSNPNEEYMMFFRLLEKKTYRAEILERYPALSEFLDILSENQYQFWIEFFSRLQKDWEVICSNFFENEQDIYIDSLKANISDPHNKGKMVVQIRVNRKSGFYYKPHGLGNEVFLRDLITRISTVHGWKNHWQNILDMDAYGWTEEILHHPCDHREEIHRFYQKTGMLAAVSYVLGMGDLHYENIVANRDNPVIIDAETLFQYMNPIYQWREEGIVFYSALTSGLFPGGTVGKNVSGVMGGDGDQYGREVPVILNDRTSEMRVGYARPRLEKGKNHVQYHKERINIARYENGIIDGFNITYQWFLENHKEVMEMIRKRQNGLYSRYTGGATQFYAMGISASTHPQLLMKQGGREKYLEKITGGRPLNIWEREAMRGGDIPWFGRHLDDCNLYSNRETVCPDFFEKTLMDQLEQRFAQLTIDDNILQQKALGLSVRLYADEKKWINGTGDRVADIKMPEAASIRWGKEKCSACGKAYKNARKIADEIMSNAIRCGKNIFWLSITSMGEQLVIKPVDYYFYSGIGGIAVFFRKLCMIHPEYEDVCAILEKMLFSYTNKINNKEILPNTEYTGMYCGESSVAYAYQLFYKLTNNEKYLLHAGRHLQAVSSCIAKDRRFDLLYGNAGIILILCQQYLYTNDDYYIDEAYKALDILERNCKESESGVVWNGEGNEKSVCSIAHGNSGMLMAYARMNSIVPNQNYIKRMKQIVAYENQFYDEQTGNWADLRKEGEDLYNTYAWCNGGLGVLYARMQAAKWNPKEKWLRKEVEEKIVPLCRNVRVRDRMCLCHGNVGNFMIMKEIGDYLADMEMRDLLIRFGKSIFLKRDRDCGAGILQERYNMGMMDGLAGLGMFCIDIFY